MMERCAHCGTVHYVGVNPAVNVNGLYFCKVSCRNSYLAKR